MTLNSNVKERIDRGELLELPGNPLLVLFVGLCNQQITQAHIWDVRIDEMVLVFRNTKCGIAEA